MFRPLRDPAGIRPSHYYIDDEVVVVASERAAIQTAFNLYPEQIQELGPGNALIVKKSGNVEEVNIIEPVERKSCSFERIYFSRGNDQEIYAERKELGRLLAQPVMDMLGNDLVNTVFSYVPNTAATSFYGLIDGGRTPFRLHFRRPCYIYYQAYPEMIEGGMLSDAILTMSSMNVIAGELDA